MNETEKPVFWLGVGSGNGGAGVFLILSALSIKSSGSGDILTFGIGLALTGLFVVGVSIWWAMRQAKP